MSRSGRVTLIQQNDTHAHIESHWELRWRTGSPEILRTGGYAHLRALADSIRQLTRLDLEVSNGRVCDFAQAHPGCCRW